VAALKAGKEIPGELLYASHESLRVLYECSTPELDWFVAEAAKVPGINGARLTGAGWGGCAIAVGGREALERAAAELPQLYERTFGRAPRTWITEAAAGAKTDGEPGGSAERDRG
jgi:galactokinase